VAFWFECVNCICFAETAPYSPIVDPRFLVFEFTWNILLRERQVIMVREFMESMSNGKSMVKQMIMGQGKTTVVGPLLALMLGDSKSLVCQVCRSLKVHVFFDKVLTSSSATRIKVVPPALLEFSRSVMRSTFSSIMHKRIYTLHCDRASKVDKALFNKLTNAIRTNGVVIR